MYVFIYLIYYQSRRSVFDGVCFDFDNVVTRSILLSYVCHIPFIFSMYLQLGICVPFFFSCDSIEYDFTPRLVIHRYRCVKEWLWRFSWMAIRWHPLPISKSPLVQISHLTWNILQKINRLWRLEDVPSFFAFSPAISLKITRLIKLLTFLNFVTRTSLTFFRQVFMTRSDASKGTRSTIPCFT